MAKPPEQLADLSVHAKHAENAVTAAKKEAHDNVMRRRESARAAANAAIQKVDKSAGNDVRSAGDAATKKWTALQTKVAGDLESLKSEIAQQKPDWDARRTESQADRLEWEASVAVDYAIAAIEQAEVAILQAVAGRMKATETRNA